jgi:hypothetical protein
MGESGDQSGGIFTLVVGAHLAVLRHLSVYNGPQANDLSVKHRSGRIEPVAELWPVQHQRIIKFLLQALITLQHAYGDSHQGDCNNALEMAYTVNNTMMVTIKRGSLGQEDAISEQKGTNKNKFRGRRGMN